MHAQQSYIKIMDRNSFIQLVFATHQVANILPPDYGVICSCIKNSSNRVLTDLLIFAENNPVTLEQKRSIIPRTLQEIDILYAYFQQARQAELIDSDNFLVLEQEYSKVKELLAIFLRNTALPTEIQPKQAEYRAPRIIHNANNGQDNKNNQRKPLLRKLSQEHNIATLRNSDTPINSIRPALTQRQEKIMGILQNKEKAQIWEMQKIMPEVTKRTLRRDFDDLLKKGYIQRIGEWNTVSYTLLD